MIALPSSHMDLLTGPIVVTLATLMPDGHPQANPIWVDVVDGKIRLNTVAGRQKDKNLRERNMATILAVDPDDPMRWIEIRGKVVYESDPDVDERSGIDALARLYLGEEVYPWHVDTDRRVTYHIAPERVVTSG